MNDQQKQIYALYRHLFTFYPPAFRKQFGESMRKRLLTSFMNGEEKARKVGWALCIGRKLR